MSRDGDTSANCPVVLKDALGEHGWAVREAWPPRSAESWHALWGLDGVAEELDQALVRHPEFVTLQPSRRDGVAVYASRLQFFKHVLTSLQRWCELAEFIPLDRWANALLRRLTGEAPRSLEPIWNALSTVGLESSPPAPSANASAAEDLWDRTMAGASVFRLRAHVQLALAMELRPRLNLTVDSARPQVEILYAAEGADEFTRWVDVRRAIKPRLAFILEQRLFHGTPYSDLSNELRISSSRIRQLEAVGVRRLKRQRAMVGFRGTIARLLARLGSPLLSRADTLAKVLAPQFDEPVESRALLRLLADVTWSEVEDLDGVLIWIGPRQWDPFVPAVPRSGPGRFVPRPNRCHARIPLGINSRFFELKRIELILSGAGELEFKLPGVVNSVDQRITRAFARGAGHGLLHLATAEVVTELSESLAFWRELACQFVQRLCARGECLPTDREILEIQPPLEDLNRLCRAQPDMLGGRRATIDDLLRYWNRLQLEVREGLSGSTEGLQQYLDRHGPGWHVTGRIHLWLEENRIGPQPFRLHATYVTSANAQGREVHTPLDLTLSRFTETRDNLALRAITAPVQQVGRRSTFLGSLFDSGRILARCDLTASEAFSFLSDMNHAAGAGMQLHVPEWWLRRERTAPRIRVRVGGRPVPSLNVPALVDFSLEVVLEGDVLDEAEVERILAVSHGLVFLRNRWIEAQGTRLSAVINEWCRLKSAGGVSMSEAVRLLARREQEIPGKEGDRDRSLPIIEAEPWLTSALATLARPESIEDDARRPETTLPLRSYQKIGFDWLSLLYRFGLGGCLADEMGLGKTIQVLALLDWLRRRPESRSALLVVPASLVANWEDEIRRFLPDLKIHVEHSSWNGPMFANTDDSLDVLRVDVVIVTYSSIHRTDWLGRFSWDVIVLDEAQMIKSPDALATRALKRLRSRCRIALTGTPIENQIADLWSIFDFINPGLLGTFEEFQDFLVSHAAKNGVSIPALQRLTAPYLLRRMKSDPAVRSVLPEKLEIEVPCSLSRSQGALYQQAVNDLEKESRRASHLELRGIIFKYVHRLKQICNHPSHCLRDGRYAVEESGKFIRLKDLAQRLAASGEKMLVFTQYRQIAEPLSNLLSGIFGRPGLVMSSTVPLRQRRTQVVAFQTDPQIPFMILTLKTGGAGLNLTAASHVIHFDRWWNPAVENQATDRAHRIGQEKVVTVHKFICRGTLEERIGELLRRKQALAEEVLATDEEAILGRMSREELLATVSLDLKGVVNDDT